MERRGPVGNLRAGKRRGMRVASGVHMWSAEAPHVRGHVATCAVVCEWEESEGALPSAAQR